MSDLDRPLDLSGAPVPLRVELPPHALLALHLHAERADIPVEDYLQALILQGIRTRQQDLDPSRRCPTLGEVEETMRQLRSEVDRHNDSRARIRLHGAIITMARLALAAGLAEYPEPILPH